MSVYLLCSDGIPYECGKHCGVFSSRAAADKYAHENGLREWWIEAYEVDELLQPESEGRNGG